MNKVVEIIIQHDYNKTIYNVLSIVALKILPVF